MQQQTQGAGPQQMMAAYMNGRQPGTSRGQCGDGMDQFGAQRVAEAQQMGHSMAGERQLMQESLINQQQIASIARPDFYVPANRRTGLAFSQNVPSVGLYGVNQFASRPAIQPPNYAQKPLMPNAWNGMVETAVLERQASIEKYRLNSTVANSPAKPMQMRGGIPQYNGPSSPKYSVKAGPQGPTRMI
jgi:hypothetical protein